VLIEKGAGLGSGFLDENYIERGATITDDVDELWDSSDMIMKVKEPVAAEYSKIREGKSYSPTSTLQQAVN
jgi:alanine dehydrogenase